MIIWKHLYQGVWSLGVQEVEGNKRMDTGHQMEQLGRLFVWDVQVHEMKGLSCKYSQQKKTIVYDKQ